MGVRYFRDVVPTGMSRQDVWSAGKNADLIFVDGDYGGNPSSVGGSAGRSPRSAVGGAAGISAAVALTTGRNSVVYVRPRGTAAAAQIYYADNITIPLTRAGLKIVGAGSDESCPYMGVDIKALTVTSPVMTVYAPAVTIEGMRLAGTGQTADTASILDVSNNGTTTRAYGLTVRGCRFANGKGHLINAGAAISIDTAIFCKIQKCNFSDNLASITARSVYAASQGLEISDCNFGGLPTSGRDVDIYIVADSEQLLIARCNFNDGLPSHGVVSRFMYLQLTYGMVVDCNFAISGATTDAVIGTAGAGAIIPTTTFIVNCHMEGTAEGIGITSR